MEILSHDQLRLVEEQWFPWAPTVFFFPFFVARQEVENKLFHVQFNYKIKFTNDHRLNSAKLIYYDYKDQLDESLQ